MGLIFLNNSFIFILLVLTHWESGNKEWARSTNYFNDYMLVYAS